MDPLFPFYASHLLRNRSRSGSIQQLSLSLSVQSRRYFRFSGCKSPSLTSWRDKTRERARRRNCLVGEKEKEDPFSRALIAFSSSLPPRDFNSNCVVFDPFPHSSRRAVKIGAIKWTLWRWRQEKWKNQFDCHRRKCGNSLSLSLVASNRNRKLIIFLRSVCRLCRSSAPLTSTAPTLFFFFFPPLFPDDQKNRKKDKR